MKKMILIAAASMLATGPVVAQGMGDDMPNVEQATGGSVIEREMGVQADDDMDDDMTMPPAPPTTMPPPQPRSTTMPPPPRQQPRMEYQRGQMPAGATTPSVPGGDYPVCTAERTDMCVNPGAM